MSINRIAIKGNIHQSLFSFFWKWLEEKGFDFQGIPEDQAFNLGIAIYLRDNVIYKNPNMGEVGNTIDITDGNISKAMALIEERNVNTFTAEDGKKVWVNDDGSVSYGCTTVSASDVKKILDLLKNN